MNNTNIWTQPCVGLNYFGVRYFTHPWYWCRSSRIATMNGAQQNANGFDSGPFWSRNGMNEGTERK